MLPIPWVGLQGHPIFLDGRQKRMLLKIFDADAERRMLQIIFDADAEKRMLMSIIHAGAEKVMLKISENTLLKSAVCWHRLDISSTNTTKKSTIFS